MRFCRSPPLVSLLANARYAWSSYMVAEIEGVRRMVSLRRPLEVVDAPGASVMTWSEGEGGQG
jgi:hypothetical protein